MCIDCRSNFNEGSVEVIFTFNFPLCFVVIILYQYVHGGRSRGLVKHVWHSTIPSPHLFPSYSGTTIGSILEFSKSTKCCAGTRPSAIPCPSTQGILHCSYLNLHSKKLELTEGSTVDGSLWPGLGQGGPSGWSCWCGRSGRSVHQCCTILLLQFSHWHFPALCRLCPGPCLQRWVRVFPFDSRLIFLFMLCHPHEPLWLINQHFHNESDAHGQ